jgi:acetylornithine deacetylase/succinyl-diaminopimelate desuccinylase-like protein
MILVNELWRSVARIGRDERTGGYRRFAWTAADLACRDWFRAAAAERSLPSVVDGNGNLWAWWDEPGAGAVVTGSHLDSVPDGWLDVRAPDRETLTRLFDGIQSMAQSHASRDRTRVTISQESYSGAVDFDPDLLNRIQRVLGNVPAIATGAGHDAGVLAAEVPTAMLFVRNPSGVSHSPAEFATEQDCAEGIVALANVLESLASD